MANMGMGQFAETSEKMGDMMKNAGMDGRLFRVGEEVSVKQSKFTVENITEHELVLRLIPDDNFQQVPKQR